ncbi:MAG TPA: metal ABC transporter substrate-binding protein [Gemmataceae bacterium]|jgi:ABC-type Zn uptake system ZnuABC Zn-binding protein ZnuA
MTKRRTAAMVVILAVFALAGCARSTPLWLKRGGPPRVVVTIPALDSFVRNVGGEHVGIVCLCTATGPHHYEYLPDDAILLRDADLFFAVGLTLDDKFADPIQTESHNARLRYVKLGERLPKKLLRKGEEHEHGKEEAKHEHEHAHEHGEYDPHVWLGIPQAIAMVEIIRDELKKVDADPAHQADYDKNAAAYIEKLEKLHADGKAQIKDKKNRKIIAFHESLGYFADSFDLKIVDAIEMTPGHEASPAHQAKLVEKCKAEDVRVIAVEPQYQQGSSATVLKDEVKNIEFAEVDPLETAADADLNGDRKELKSKGWYETKMQQNLDELAKRLP